VPAWRWIATLGLAALCLGGWLTWRGGLYTPPRPPLVESPEAERAGREVFLYRCNGCHRDVPLARRVAGWSADRAYQTIGRLPAVPRAGMPPFLGTEQDRRDLAAFLAAVGAGRIRQP
jgi:mono/diheme cytochrome c family protein